MEILNIEARQKRKACLPAKALRELPERIVLAASVQYLGMLGEIARELRPRKTRLFCGRAKAGQVLGCDIRAVDDADAVLFVGDGLFHPLALALESPIPVFVFNPCTGGFSRVGAGDLEKIRRKRQAAIKKFLAAQKIGILVSTKPGQCRLPDAFRLKERLGRDAFILLADTIDAQSLEDFSFVDVFVNTACPRIATDNRFPKPVISYDDALRLLDE